MKNCYFSFMAIIVMALITVNFASCEKSEEPIPDNPIEVKDTFSVSFTIKVTLETPYDAAKYFHDDDSGLIGSLTTCSADGNDYFNIFVNKADFADGVTYEKTVVVTGDSARTMIGMDLVAGAGVKIWPRENYSGGYVKQWTTPESPILAKVEKNNSYEIKVYFEEE
jgi:hypothetical protein